MCRRALFLTFACAIIVIGAGCERDAPPPPLLPPPLHPGTLTPPPVPPPAAFPAIPRMAAPNLRATLNDPQGDTVGNRGDIKEVTARLEARKIIVQIRLYGIVDKALTYRFWITTDINPRKPLAVMVNTAVSDTMFVQLDGREITQLSRSVELGDAVKFTVPLDILPEGYKNAANWFVTGVESLDFVKGPSGSLGPVTLDKVEGGIALP